MVTLTKPSQQSCTESCVVSGNRRSRSVDRKIAGRNKVKRIISPEIERVVKQPTFSLNGEGRNLGSRER